MQQAYAYRRTLVVLGGSRFLMSEVTLYVSFKYSSEVPLYVSFKHAPGVEIGSGGGRWGITTARGDAHTGRRRGTALAVRGYLAHKKHVTATA